MFKRFSNTRARAPCNPRRGAVFAPKWAKKFCKPALRQLAKFRVHSRSIAIKNRVIVSFFALSRLFALIRPTPSAFYHSSRKLTTGSDFCCRWSVFIVGTLFYTACDRCALAVQNRQKSAVYHQIMRRVVVLRLLRQGGFLT